MLIHYQKFGEELVTVETNRVTMLENGQEKFQIPGRVLVFGYSPQVISFKDIQWFWIEEN